MGRNTRAGDIKEMFHKEKSSRKDAIAHVAPIIFWAEKGGGAGGGETAVYKMTHNEQMRREGETSSAGPVYP